jgi:hypothetical protein
MLLDADLLADDLYERARHTGTRSRWDPSAILAARAEAEHLAAGNQPDEPAALFFALARRSRAFGILAAAFIPGAARAQAMAVGHELLVDDLELSMLRAGVLRGEIRFDDLRRWFADSLRPLSPRG